MFADRLRPFGILLLVLSLGLGAPLLASEPAPAPQEEEEMEEGQRTPVEEEAVLDEITVTAQKRVENIQEVPVAISTLDTEQLDQITVGNQDVRALSARVPSLILESSFGRAFPRFYIRGLGNTDFDLNASQPVSMVYDDVVLENAILKGMPIWDMERVEVLRGPQGTLFGRNTPAGVVKFESKRPTQEFDSYVRASLGTYTTGDVQAAIGGGLTETVSARASVLWQTRDDWVDNGFTGENDALGGYDTTALRLQFLWEPTEQFSTLLNIHAWDVDGTARLFRANMIEPGTNNVVAGFEPDRVFYDGLNSQDIESQGATLTFDYLFDGATLTSVTSFETLEMYSRGDIDGGFGASFAPPFGPGFIPFNSESADGLPDLDQFTQEFRLSSNSEGPWSWLAGLFYFDEDLQIDTFSYNSLAPGNPQDGYAFQKQSAQAFGLFANVEYRIFERWKLQVGARYSDEEKDFSAERPDPVFQTPTVQPIVRDVSDDFLSWNLSATWEMTDNLNLYGRVATGFRAPSIQGRILFAPDFEGGLNPATNGVSIADTEDILSYEVGVKSELLDRRLRLNATVYSYEVNDQQIVAVGGEFNVATLLNADTTDGYGFEADVQFAPTSRWLVTMGLSNNNTEIDDSTLSVVPCGGGCTVLDPIGPNGALVDGNSLPHAPEWIFNGIIDYRLPVGNGLFAAALDWAYYDDKSFFLYESAEFHDDSFELGARFGWIFSDGRYEVTLWGRNLTDEVIIRNGIDFNNLTGMINDPLTVGLGFNAKFF
jgi:iron complex outermembrane receptor protein